MFVYIAHAEADQAAADDLAAFLKSRGMVVHSETGTRGFRHLQSSDVVIGLWSQKAVFSAHRMLMEKRMLEAWADEQLVLVKLDHGFLPVGLRDLPVVDATFEDGRELAVWPNVERAAKAAMNAALDRPRVPVEQHEDDDTDREALLTKARVGAYQEYVRLLGQIDRTEEDQERFERLKRRIAEIDAAMSGRRDLADELAQASMRIDLPHVDMPPAETRALPPPGAAPTPQAEKRPDRQPEQPAAKHGGIFGGLFGKKRTTAVAPPPARSESMTVSTPAKQEVAPQAVFISYCHADDAAVTRVVALVEDSGRVVWMDKSGISPGEGWAGEIVRAIRQARGVLVMCSPKAFESDHVKREVYLADRYKKPMLPVFIEAASPPEDFEYFFASVQCLELFKLPEADRPAAIGKALAAV